MSETKPDFGIEKVFFYGDLAEKFGAELEIYAESAAKALQIVEANFYGQFYTRLREGEYFVWRENGESLENIEDIGLLTSCKELHIMPSVAGEGGRGGMMSVLGTVLVGAALFFSGGLAAGGILPAFQAMQGTIWGTVAQLGMGLALSGISTLLGPKLPIDNGANEERKTSYIYSGPINLEHEGSAIPLIYGFPMVGSVVISGGVEVEDIPLGVDEAGEAEGSVEVTRQNWLGGPVNE